MIELVFCDEVSQQNRHLKSKKETLGNKQWEKQVPVAMFILPKKTFKYLQPSVPEEAGAHEPCKAGYFLSINRKKTETAI